MTVSRRTFVKHATASLATMGLGFTAFSLRGASTAVAAGNRASSRNLVVVYLAGGNDALSFLVPYADPAYYSRRPTQAVPADRVLQIGADANGTMLGLHPNLVGLKSIFDRGHVSLIPRTGYTRSSRSHFVGSDIVSTGDPSRPQGTGWLGRYLDSLQTPVEPLFAWNTQFQLPRALVADAIRVPSIRDPGAYVYFHPWGEGQTAARLAANLAHGDPHLAFLNATTTTALTTIPRVATIAPYRPAVTYPGSALGATLQMVAAAIGADVGAKVFWVQAGGYDTHAVQGTVDGTYSGLMKVLDDALTAFHDDLEKQGLIDNTMILQFSEFGRRVDENGSQGTDHGAAGLMMAIGGKVRGGIFGAAARSLADTGDNPDLENSGRDVRHHTDFRSVYARVIDDWLGSDSVPILLGDYRNAAIDFV